MRFHLLVIYIKSNEHIPVEYLLDFCEIDQKNQKRDKKNIIFSLTFALMSNRDLTNSEVTLQFRNGKFGPDAPKFRRLFMQLPKLRNFDVEFSGYLRV